MTMALFYLALSLSLATLVQTATIYGTENGYDAGGTEPICFTSKINDANRSIAALVPPVLPVNVPGSMQEGLESLQKGSLEALNEKLFEGQSSEFELLSSCFEGTDLDVEPLDLGADRLLETGSNYTFRVPLQVLLSQISDKRIGNYTIFVRFILCDAIRQGFCSPLQDTRELDQNLRPFQTDLDADETDSFEDGDNKWQYQQGNVLLGIADGLIVLSRWVKWTLREVEKDSDLYKASVDITLQLPKGIREGAYFFIGHVVMNFEESDGNIERVDIANAIPDNVVEVRNPPTIHKVSDSMKIVVGVASGVFGAFALFCFGSIIYYRDNPVMRLAQGPFLAALAACCLVSIGFTFTFLPSRDVFCRLRGPMTLVPITTAAAILVARTWRIYVTLSVALSLGRGGTKGRKQAGTDFGQRLVILLSFLAQLPYLIFRNPCKRKRGMQRRMSSVPSLRQGVPAEETISLIAFISFPQVFLQVFAALYYSKELEVELDPNVNIGRYVCNGNGNWALVAGWGITAAVFLLAVAVAWISRKLPSAFNEKDQVFHAATISAVAAVVVASLDVITNNVTASPDVQVFLRSSCIICVAMSVLVIIVWPKIRRVLSGEKVVVSGLLGSNLTSSAFSSPKAESRNRITVNKDDPIPKKIEAGILAMEELLQGVTNCCGEGRPLSLEDWKRIRIDVAKLHNDLELIDLAWTENDQEDSISATATIIHSVVGNKTKIAESAGGENGLSSV